MSVTSTVPLGAPAGAAEPVSLVPGARFAERYQVLRCIKAGGMGAVYEVLHVETRKRRALKVMLPALVRDPGMRQRFKVEATVTADIDSEHIVETLDAGVDSATGAPFLVMELLKGQDLGAVLDARGSLPPTEVITLLWQAALALDRTHAAGVVHRDLKPENLFLTRRDDGSPRVKILDFGIAKVVADSAVAQTTLSVGTPLYMPPEQMRGDGAIGSRADVYALTHVAYALLVGEPYWQTEQREVQALYPLLGRVIAGAKEPPSVRAARRGVLLPAAFDGWFSSGSAILASDRFESTGRLIAELANVFRIDLSRSTETNASQVTLPAVPAPESSRELPARTTGPVSGVSLPEERRGRRGLVIVGASVLLAGVAFVVLVRPLFVSASETNHSTLESTGPAAPLTPGAATAPPTTNSPTSTDAPASGASTGSVARAASSARSPLPARSPHGAPPPLRTSQPGSTKSPPSSPTYTGKID